MIALQKGRHSMKLRFKVQHYQTDAIGAVVWTFAGQAEHDGVSYLIDPFRIRVRNA